MENPSCILSPTELLGVLTKRGEVVAMDNAVGARLLLLMQAANSERAKEAA
jgi:hypothetical protein